MCVRDALFVLLQSKVRKKKKRNKKGGGGDDGARGLKKSRGQYCSADSCSSHLLFSVCGDLCLIYVYRHSISIVFYVYLFELDSDRIFHIYHWQGAKLNYAHTDTHTHTKKKHIIIIRLLRYIETQRKINTTAVKTRQKKQNAFFFFPDFIYFYPFSKNYYLNYIFSLIPFLFCFLFLSLLVMILSL